MYVKLLIGLIDYVFMVQYASAFNSVSLVHSCIVKDNLLLADFMHEIDCLMERVSICNEVFKFLNGSSPYGKYLINEPFPERDFLWGMYLSLFQT